MFFFSYWGKFIKMSKRQVFYPHSSNKSLPELPRKFTAATYFFLKLVHGVSLQFTTGVAGGQG